MNREPNYLKYPSVMKEPKPIKLKNETITLYTFSFKGIDDLSRFLKTDPPINEGFNKNKLSSVYRDARFSGVSYDEAVGKLRDLKDPGYLHYLEVNSRIQKFASVNKVYKTVKTLGGTPDPIAISTNSPYTSTTRRKVRVPKTIILNVDVGISYDTEDDQLLNRALIITSLINALEKRNYNVLVNSFMLAEYEDEVIKAIFDIKGIRRQTDYQSLYKTLVDKGFFRRICFRLIEVSDVNNKWHFSYGRACSKEKCMELMKIGPNDLLFREPNQMGIAGLDIEEDFENTVELLGLNGKIDIYTEKDILKHCLIDYKEKIYHR